MPACSVRMPAACIMSKKCTNSKRECRAIPAAHARPPEVSAIRSTRHACCKESCNATSKRSPGILFDGWPSESKDYAINNSCGLQWVPKILLTYRAHLRHYIKWNKYFAWEGYKNELSTFKQFHTMHSFVWNSIRREQIQSLCNFNSRWWEPLKAFFLRRQNFDADFYIVAQGSQSVTALNLNATVTYFKI